MRCIARVPWRTARAVGMLALLLPLLLGACGGGEGASTLPKMTGKPNQVLVVSPLDIEGTPLGDTLGAILEVEYPCLPQSERSFQPSFITREEFLPLLKPFRNLILVEVGPEYPDCALRVARDRYSQGQLLVVLRGASYGALAQYVGRESALLRSLLEETEAKRLMEDYRSVADEPLQAFVRGKYHQDLAIPGGYALRCDTVGFSWISRETPDISQGLLLYTLPNRGGWSSPDSIVKHRNAFTRRFVPGPNAGTYMKVAEVLPPLVEMVAVRGDTLVRMRGLWEVEGHAMGGAFVSYTQLSAAGDSIITAGGYIYAPRYGKRRYMQELEAILRLRWQGRE